jgi:hypothetical protein
MKTYSKFVGTKEEIKLLKEKAKADGLVETETFPDLPTGSHIGTLQRDDDNNPKSFFIPYKRTENGKQVSKFFTGVVVDTTHESSGKNFNNVMLGLNDDELDTYGDKSFSGSLSLECIEYGEQKKKTMRIAS